MGSRLNSSSGVDMGADNTDALRGYAALSRDETVETILDHLNRGRMGGSQAMRKEVRIALFLYIPSVRSQNLASLLTQGTVKITAAWGKRHDED